MISTHNITEFDLFFLSYDEPNAENNWSDLLNKAPYAERVHGVKGFEAAHRACAEKSATDWFVTVDADNIVLPEFFDEQVTLDDRRPNQCYSWNGLNMMNGLMYGNGGVKLWSKKFVLDGGVGHEASDDPRHAVDFCWQEDYTQINKTFSEVWNNGSPYQAFRVGFREGVKLTLDRGERISGRDMKTRLHNVNLRNIRIWSSVGADVEHGLWAIYGARFGWKSMLQPEFDHVSVRDYDWFDTLWEAIDSELVDLDDEIARHGSYITRETGISVPLLGAAESEFFRETFRLRNE
jgi:hypothetical protein